MASSTTPGARRDSRWLIRSMVRLIETFRQEVSDVGRHPVDRGEFVGLTEIGRDHGRLGADAADDRRQLGKGERPTGQRRRDQAALEEDAEAVAQFLLNEQAASRPAGARGARSGSCGRRVRARRDEVEHLVRREVASAEDGVVLGDQAEHIENAVGEAVSRRRSRCRVRRGRAVAWIAEWVGIQISAAPIRSAASTAAGLIPPTAWLRARPPKTRIPGTTCSTR